MRIYTEIGKLGGKTEYSTNGKPRKEALPMLEICYDFIKTPTPDNIQAHEYIQSIGYDVQRFWDEADQIAHEIGMDSNLVYMYKVCLPSWT